MGFFRMILHIGGDRILFMRDVIAIIDKNSLQCSRVMLDRIEKLRKQKKLIGWKKSTVSYIFTSTMSQGKREEKVYCSGISSSTLLQRAHFLSEISLNA